MPTPTAQERKILKAVAEVRACDHILVSRKVGISSDYANQLCRYLSRWGYLEKRGNRYSLTETGQEAALKEIEREALRKGTKPEAELVGGRLIWDKWRGGLTRRLAKGGGAMPDEGLVWETYQGFIGGRGAKAISLPELLWEERYPCAFCAGEGYSPPGTKCPVCKSSGTVTIFEPPAVKCGYCKGSGRKERKVHITCIVCRGKGIVTVKEPIQFCPGCQGKGFSTEDRLPCTACKGKGVITKKERISEPVLASSIHKEASSELAARRFQHSV